MPFIVKSRSSQVAQTLKSGLMGMMQAMQLKAQMQRNKLLNKKTEKEIEWGELASGRAGAKEERDIGRDERDIAEHGERLLTSQQVRTFRGTAEERAVTLAGQQTETFGVGGGPQARFETAEEQYKAEQARLDRQVTLAERRVVIAEEGSVRDEAQLLLAQARSRRDDARAGREADIHGASMEQLTASKGAFAADKTRIIDSSERQLEGVGVVLTDADKAAFNAVEFSATSEKDLDEVQADIYARVGQEKHAEFLAYTEPWSDDPDKQHIMGAVGDLANMREMWGNPADVATVWRELGRLEVQGKKRAEVYNWTTADITNPDGFPALNSEIIDKFEGGIAAARASGQWNPAMEANMNSVRNAYEKNVQRLLGALSIEPKWNKNTNSFESIDVMSIDSQLRTMMQVGVANGRQFTITVPRLGPGGRDPYAPSAFESMANIPRIQFEGNTPAFQDWWVEEHGIPHDTAPNVFRIKFDGAEDLMPGPGYEWEDPNDDTNTNVVPIT